MATALPSDPKLECCICFESYKTPKILSCGHSFCLECLVRYIDGRKVSFPCPFCKHDVTIPRGGVNKLVTNFFLQTSMDSPRTSDNSTTKPSTSLKPKHYCPNHSKKKVDYYCQTCNLGLCAKCIYRDHKYHKTLDLECDSTKEKVVKELLNSELFFKKKIEELEQTHATLIETSVKLKSLCDEACTKIRENTENIIGDLQKHCKKRQKDIKRNFVKNESKLTETRQKVMTQINNFKTDLDKSRHTTTEEPSLTLIYSLSKLQELQKLCENMKTDIPPVTYVEWREGSFKVCDILGSTVSHPLYQSSEGSGPISTVTKPLYQSSEGSGPISTVTKPLYQSSEDSGGPISTVNKPLYQSREGSVFRFNYKDIKNDDRYCAVKSEDKCSIHGILWGCQIKTKKYSSDTYVCIYIMLLEDYIRKIKHIITLLNEYRHKNKISPTRTRKLSSYPNDGSDLTIPLDKLTDPSEGFIDDEGQFLVRLDILQV